jgi:DNA replication initiation complex subunit (GINS family)
MEDEAITFEYIRKTHKAKEYLGQKKKLMQRKQSKNISIEISNVERLLEDIYNRRERKIVQQAIIAARTEIPPENLMNEEEKLFKDILSILETHRGKTLSLLLGKTKEKSNLIEVKFKEEVPEFVGSDAKKYGPFKKGDTAKLPAENAKLMIKNDMATRK